MEPALIIAMAVLVVAMTIVQNKAITAYRRAADAAGKEGFQVGVMFAVDYSERGATKEHVVALADATMNREGFQPSLVGARLTHSPSSIFYIGHTAKDCAAQEHVNGG